MHMHEIALAVAVATPVIAVVAIDLYLAFQGETANLLLPRVRSYPSQRIEEATVQATFAELPFEQPEPEPLRKAA